MQDKKITRRDFLKFLSLLTLSSCSPHKISMKEYSGPHLNINLFTRKDQLQPVKYKIPNQIQKLLDQGLEKSYIKTIFRPDFFNQDIKTAKDISDYLKTEPKSKNKSLILSYLNKNPITPKSQIAKQLIIDPETLLIHNTNLAHHKRYQYAVFERDVKDTEIVPYKKYLETMEGNCRESAYANALILEDNGFPPYILLLSAEDPLNACHFSLIYKRDSFLECVGGYPFDSRIKSQKTYFNHNDIAALAFYVAGSCEVAFNRHHLDHSHPSKRIGKFGVIDLREISSYGKTMDIRAFYKSIAPKLIKLKQPKD